MGNGTSIGRVRGLGPAHEGTHHWLLQRFTAVGNLLLVGFFAISIVMLPDLSYAKVTEWIAKPVPATAMALLVISTFWHAKLGLQVMLEDYVHEAGNKFAVILALNLAAFGGAAFGLFCIARLALGGAA
ncbi:succinate dehydrogenase / fumarate reductase membrane anchor subunit [Altererythrobacter atlanticus]|uniref:Succinate dehydrogenase hydrophobic membrane anchor subunit n=1 Tax=Croceibacterium atlanticum TaxID=1267766 RepID=A0A0F7KP20_9SPHN|nr:succinate dehydrogenase, hydrophobic membrane anchor protein [Croceibacterium atlanticum]AKH41329.1 Succinate dehydrogenase/Fumarate reductase transmembrane subunit [Croceibacterium atlanticum]MBB5734158.1 succinate dehydrogenase / fumarate reductase membrane anchor subunit [Croceibacterium atlanticum]